MIAGLIVSTDVTEQRRSEAALRERTEDLERSNRDLEQFADIASHELKTPLRHIAGFAELLAEEHEGLLSEEADQYIAGVVQGVREMTAVIEALLRYSRAKTNENRMQSVHMGHLVKQVLGSLAPRIHEVGGHVEVDWETLPTLRGDPVLLKQLVENLVWNGLKFSQPSPVVRVSAARDLFDWVFTVEDNGPGGGSRASRDDLPDVQAQPDGRGGVGHRPVPLQEDRRHSPRENLGGAGLWAAREARGHVPVQHPCPKQGRDHTPLSAATSSGDSATPTPSFAAARSFARTGCGVSGRSKCSVNTSRATASGMRHGRKLPAPSVR